MTRIQRTLLIVALLAFSGGAAAQESQIRPIATIGELMREIIYPLSDELFYIMRSPPETDYEWTLIRRTALTLAESGNLLMTEGRAIAQDDWMRHSRELIDVATLAWEAAEARDLDGIVALSPRLETSCRACHEQYHPRYRRRSPNPVN